jgi:PAS domain-containing protein
LYIDLLNNLAITSALLFLGERFFQDRPIEASAPLMTRIYAGLGAGVLGILLMLSTIHVTDTVIVDLRHLPVTVAAMFGGPVSVILSAAIIGIVRLLWYGISTASIIAGIIAVVMGVLFGVISKMKITNSSKFILMNFFFIAASSAAVYGLIDDALLAYKTLLNYWLFSFIAGGFTYYIAELIKRTNENHQSIMYFKLMTDNASDLISTHHMDGRFKYLSPSSIKLLGYEPHELIGLNPYAFPAIHPAFLDYV